MNIKIFHKLFVLFLITATFSGFGQVKDAGFWGEMTFQKKFTTSLSADIEQEFRMDENLTELGKFFTDMRIRYKITPGFRIDFNYRFSGKKQINDNYGWQHRYYVSASFKDNVKRWSFTYRIRYQQQYSEMYSSENGLLPNNRIRNKVSIAYSFVKPVEPYISAELFSDLNNLVLVALDKARVKTGVEYEFNKMNSIDLFYLFQQDLFTPNPEMDFIFGIGYKYTIG